LRFAPFSFKTLNLPLSFKHMGTAWPIWLDCFVASFEFFGLVSRCLCPYNQSPTLDIGYIFLQNIFCFESPIRC
jgi:hypothetical protein